LLRLRRMLGLFAFFYASLHFLTYIWLDQFFAWKDIVKDIGKRPFIMLGFAAFVLLIPLAITSTNAMVRRLGARRWQGLHRLVYVLSALGVAHFWWLVKKDVTEPFIFAVLLAVLFIIRLLYLLKQQRSASLSPTARSQAA
jgi:sulfoxide reductase heme-binding subunit YedZ